jgi:hypothetical protein
MLNVVDKNTVDSTEGWRLQFSGHSPLTWRIDYIEGDKRLEIPVEGGFAGKDFFFVYLSNLLHWSSPDSEFFSDEERQRIGCNISEGLNALKIPFRMS